MSDGRLHTTYHSEMNERKEKKKKKEKRCRSREKKNSNNYMGLNIQSCVGALQQSPGGSCHLLPCWGRRRRHLGGRTGAGGRARRGRQEGTGEKVE